LSHWFRYFPLEVRRYIGYLVNTDQKQMEGGKKEMKRKERKRK